MQNTNGLYSGCFITLFFGLMIWFFIPFYIDKVNFLPPYSPGPETWPKIISYFGFFLGLLLFIISIDKKSIKNHSIENLSFLIKEKIVYIKRAFYLFVLFFVYYISTPIIGIVLSSSFFLAMLFLSKNNKKSLFFLSFLFPILLYLAFTQLTNTPFPIGSIWSIFEIN